MRVFARFPLGNLSSRLLSQVMVLVESSCFEHECELGVQAFRMAKKASCSYATDPRKLRTIVDFFTGTTISASQGRKILKSFLPPGCNISADDVRNFRARALKFDIEGEDIP